MGEVVFQTRSPWRQWGDAIVSRYALSWWRLPLLLLVAGALLFGPLFLLRGVRLVALMGVGIVGIVAAAVAFSHPHAALIAALFLIFSGLDLLLPGPVTIALMLVILARGCYDTLRGEKFDWGSTTFRVASAVLLAVVITSILVAFRPEMAGIELCRLLLPIGLYLGISQFATRSSRIVTLVLAIALGKTIATLLGLREILHHGGLIAIVLQRERIAGLGGEANTHAAEVDCILAPFFCVLGRFGGWRRWTLLPLMLILIGSVILTQSRGGMLVLGLLFVAILVRSKYGRGVVLLALAGGLCLLLLMPRSYWVRFVSIAQLNGIVLDRSLQVRQHVLAGGWRMFLDHPWLGVGFGNFRVHSPTFMLGGYAAHNSYVEVAATLGIVGIAAYLVWMWSGLWMAREAAGSWRRAGNRPDQALAENIALGLLTFFIVALTLSIEFYIVLWVLLGLANAARRCARSAGETLPGGAGMSQLASTARGVADPRDLITRVVR